VSRRLVFWVLVALQAAVPVALAGLREADLAFGRHVLIQAYPVDPIDPFRGEYVALRFPISRLGADYGSGRTVYVTLRKSGRGWVEDYASPSKPSNGTFIRGVVREGGNVEYGIETFYVEQGRARRYAGAMAERRLYADVALSSDGRAHLDGVKIFPR